MRMNLRILSIVFLVLLAGVLVAWAGSEENEIVTVGQIAPDFKVETPGGIISTADLKGKVVLINFFATWCPPCREELPILQKQVWEKYKDNDKFELLVIGREHSKEELDAFAKKNELDLPFYPDADRAIFSKFAKQSIPRNYIIGKGGKIVYASKGYSTKEFEHLMSVLAKQL